MLSAKISFFLCFYTLISKGAWRPCVKKRTYAFLFFSVLPRIRTSEREERKHIILTGDRLGEITLGGASRKRENRGVKFIGRLNMRFLLHIITTQQGTFSQGLSYPSSNQFKSNPLGLLRYLHIVRTKNWEIDKDRNKGGAEDREKETEI